MASQAQRIADLERQVLDLRADFDAATDALRFAFQAGVQSVLNPRVPQPLARHLRAVRDPEPELEAGA
jgi:hypothetical protein